MAVLEVGINIGKKPILEIKYYSSSDNILDGVTRAKFLTGIENFIDEAFGDRISVISLSDFKLISYSKKIQVTEKDKNKKKQLLSFAIIEQDTNPNFVKKHLKKILSEFRTQYTPSEIFNKDPSYFKKFEQQIDKILGDLRLKLDDRLKTLFRDKD